MRQISLTKSDSDGLTAGQRSAWDRRGFLILKSHLSSREVARLAVSGAEDAASAREALIESLRDVAEAILEADPILLSLRPGAPEVFGMDALDRASGPTVRGVTAVVMLEPSAVAPWEHSLFAASHLIPAGPRHEGWGDAMVRVSEEIRARGLTRDPLGMDAGDVWIRHPRLVRGVLRRAGPDSPPAWLVASFGRLDDLPGAWTSGGLEDGGGSVRSVFPEARPSGFSRGHGIVVS